MEKYKKPLILTLFFFCISFCLPSKSLYAEKLVANVTAEGACAIVGMSAEQCQMTALKRARASAIEHSDCV